MIDVSNEARQELKKLLVSEINSYSDRYPGMLDDYTFAITLCESARDATQWDLAPAAVSKSLPETSFVISSGIQFHHAKIKTVDARVEYGAGAFTVNGQGVNLVGSGASQ